MNLETVIRTAEHLLWVECKGRIQALWSEFSTLFRPLRQGYVGPAHFASFAVVEMVERPPLRLKLQPRGLTREVAAAYCGLTATGFDEWVKRGLVPGPIPGTQRWDRKAIDGALDRASGLESAQAADDPFERWRVTYDAGSS